MNLSTSSEQEATLILYPVRRSTFLLRNGNKSGTDTLLHSWDRLPRKLSLFLPAFPLLLWFQSIFHHQSVSQLSLHFVSFTSVRLPAYNVTPE